MFFSPFNKQEAESNFRVGEADSILHRRLSEGFFILVLAWAVFLLIALLSYHTSDPAWSNATAKGSVLNLGGYVGAYSADILFCLFGFVAYLFPLLLAYGAWIPCRDARRQEEARRFSFIVRTLSFLAVLVAASSLVKLHFFSAGLPFGTGGALGNLFSLIMQSAFSAVGANLILLALFLSALTLFTGVSWIKVVDYLGQLALVAIDYFGAKVFELVTFAWRGSEVTGKFKSHFEHKFVLPQELPLAPVVMPSKAPLISKPETIKTSVRAEKERQISLFEPDLEGSLPPLSLLDMPEKSKDVGYTDEQLEAMSKEVEMHLREFGIEAAVVAVHPGPVVTRFELDLAAGTKVSRITALAKDLARSLSVVSVRIVEVIPGKSVVGLELPNAKREIVRLREILSSQQYEHARSPLTLALGKDIAGYPVIVDLAKMPHLLVAGTTGSGKSVGLNAMMLSFLYKYTPKDLRLILIDPKMLELSVYDGIPHLLTPVVTDMKEASNALRWAVVEMERRYKLLAAMGVRNLSSYNHKVREAREKGAPLIDPLWEPPEFDMSQTAEESAQAEIPKAPLLQELPYIVIIADEYADMIMVVGKKVEELIARLAQKARASGIHLILATQRPSVDVITGLIKANISTRIAFQVSSKIDSRTILDQSGAEQLLGHGDMLYLPPGSGVPIRVHGAFVADEEVHRVAKDLKRRGEPQYLSEILENDIGGFLPGIDSEKEQMAALINDDPEKDELYDQAVQIVLETKRASISGVQRRLRIGYNRAARLIEAMEKAGLVGAMESNGNRAILVPTRDE